MFLKIIWENAGETLVDCARVRVAPVFDGTHKDGSDAVTILFEALDHDDRPQGLYHVWPTADVQVFIMNEKGATIENWHTDRRVALAKGVSAPYGLPDGDPRAPIKKNPLIDPLAAVERYKAKEASAPNDDLDTSATAR